MTIAGGWNSRRQRKTLGKKEKLKRKENFGEKKNIEVIAIAGWVKQKDVWKGAQTSNNNKTITNNTNNRTISETETLQLKKSEPGVNWKEESQVQVDSREQDAGI